MFLAKLNAGSHKITLNNAWDYIPVAFELIKELVDFLKELKREEYTQTRWIVEEVLTIMNHFDLMAIKESLSFTKKRQDKDNMPVKDPYIYFYKDFLAAYDKKLKKAKGVYYTPPPIVNFIVRAIDDVLIDTFNLKDGLADYKNVTVLDFATGTGTFLVEVIQQIFNKLPKDSGMKDLLIKEHILKNIYGFEYLIAPYTIAHLKLSQFLKDNGYNLTSKERIQVYLTNTLEPVSAQIKIPLLPALSDESRRAQNIKDKPILVITGNPPYSGHSKNNGTWIKAKIQEYFYVDGKPLGEKNPKWLQDDYVKFIRFAQDKMDKVEEGIVGIITNHSFLDNPTFRGMRHSLLKTFNRIHIIDLHGNADKKEKTPDGGKDSNVFDIKQGVAISIFIKKKGLKRKILHTDFWGIRNEKYNKCLLNNLNTIEWNLLKPTFPFFLFVNQNTEHKYLYEKYYSISSIFKNYKLGIFTHRDKFLIDFENEILEKRISKFKNADSSVKIEEMFGLKNTRDWKIDVSLNEIKKHSIEIFPYSFKPFDKRYICYNQEMFDRGCSRYELMRPILKYKTLALNTSRNLQIQGEFKDVLVSNLLTDAHYCTGGNYVFPLYVMPSIPEIFENTNHENGIEQIELFENFTDDFRKYINELYSDNFSPEDIFGYIYAILHSHTYRKKYSVFLKTDFPRIPFSDDKQIFINLATLGNELINAHLLEKSINTIYGNFMGPGLPVVEKITFAVQNGIGKLYLNKIHYYDNVPQEVYDFYIGGYQVIHHYFKDRMGKELNLDEVSNITSTIKAIEFTIRQMKIIDEHTKNWI